MYKNTKYKSLGLQKSIFKPNKYFILAARTDKIKI